MKFDSLLQSKPLLQSLDEVGYEAATAIQQQAIPPILRGRDLVGCAQTGTGKTAAFALPMLQQLIAPATTRMRGAQRSGAQKGAVRHTAAKTGAALTGAVRRRRRSGRRVIRGLIVAPTRELAGQIQESLETYGQFTGLRYAVIFGGVKQSPQVQALQSGVDILVATPGRLLDLIQQGYVDLADVEILILDEADQMLDMGFIHDLRKIVAHTPSERQTLMFSATMPPEIRQLASQWLRRPVAIQVAPIASTPQRVEQAVRFVERHRKAKTLFRLLDESRDVKTLVFSRTRRGADKIARILQRDGIRALAIHGDKSQMKRQAAIRQFNAPRPPVLVATDLAARGLDFSDVMQVINYDMPEVPETYVHRIGRTARAGAAGYAISLCSPDERHRLRSIEKLTGQPVAEVTSQACLDHSSDRRSECSSSKNGQPGGTTRSSSHETQAAATNQECDRQVCSKKTGGGNRQRSRRTTARPSKSAKNSSSTRNSGSTGRPSSVNQNGQKPKSNKRSQRRAKALRNKRNRAQRTANGR